MPKWAVPFGMVLRPVRCVWTILATLTSSVVVTTAHASDANEHQGTGAQGARWTDGVVRLSVDESFEELEPRAFEALVGAVSAWQESAIALPTLVAQRGSSPTVGYRVGESNENTVIFEPGKSEMANGALAITILTFDREAGQILDADIVVNGEHNFGVVDDMEPREAKRSYDIQNVLTHELGHFLGLGEDYDDNDATMYAYSMPGEVNKRDLASRDTAVVDHLYQPLEHNPEVGCSGASIAARRQPYAWWVAFIGVAGVSHFARRRAARLARMGSAVSAGLLAFCLGIGEFSVAPEWMVVTEVHSEWQDGLVVTRAALRPADCSDCDATSVRFLGGTVGNITQQVGRLRPPGVGARVLLAPDGTSSAFGSTELGLGDLALVERRQ
jgi:Matrixin